MGVDLGSTEAVSVFAEVTKDGEVVDLSVIETSEPWITNLLPFPEED